ncbi:hypothetical protein DS909_06695 [Phaeobacter gallaeciensis]|uniref:HTH cro/C1-type domain-containing protein n=2 Tax=Phaeobacter gallaeciensis TaxID=60890 RepID=A0A366X455_9RHOB|nr:hypothetical protein DS909_06695 [Phaeobacter gallaeciensis]
MYSDMEISDRLKQARIDAGFRSAREAANRFNWTGSTYAAHENGTRGIKTPEIQRYAQAFRADPCFIAFGIETQTNPIAGVSEKVLREVVNFVMDHEGAKESSADVLADLIIDLCNYAKQSGETGLGNIVDFEFARRAAQGS